MQKINRNRSLTPILRRTAVALLAVGLLAGTGTAVAAADGTGARQDKVITLPGAISAEGIAAGRGSQFYAGDLYSGDIFRGDIRRGTAERFIDAPQGRVASGMKVDLRDDLLFVAGGPTGQAYVYSTRTGATVATYQFDRGSSFDAFPYTSYINDVALTPTGAWFTDSRQAKLYFVPVGKDGELGQVRTLELTGPAADTSGNFNLNGIQATPDGRTLIVGHTENNLIYTVNPHTGASAVIEGVKVPNVDGIVLDGHQLWAAENFNNRFTKWRLSGDLTRGTSTKTITSPAFHVPSTAALFGHRLAAVNTHFDTGFPPTSPTYEVVIVHS